MIPSKESFYGVIQFPARRTEKNGPITSGPIRSLVADFEKEGGSSYGDGRDAGLKERGQKYIDVLFVDVLKDIGTAKEIATVSSRCRPSLILGTDQRPALKLASVSGYSRDKESRGSW